MFLDYRRTLHSCAVQYRNCQRSEKIPKVLSLIHSIYINGRKMQDQMELQRLQPNDIKKIEVINNPGARYDANVKSVIRITTKKPQGEGFSFDNKTTFRVNEDKRLSSYESFLTNYRKGGLDVNAFLYGAYSHTQCYKQ